jgi:hypothetical protein
VGVVRLLRIIGHAEKRKRVTLLFGTSVNLVLINNLKGTIVNPDKSQNHYFLRKSMLVFKVCMHRFSLAKYLILKGYLVI